MLAFSGVASRRGCGQNRRRLRMRHIYETTETKEIFSRVPSRYTSNSPGWLPPKQTRRKSRLFLQFSHHKRPISTPENPHQKTWSRSFRSVANTVGCHVRMAPRIAGENKRYYSRHPGTLRISRVHTSRKVTFPLLSRPAWTLALKGWASKEGPEAHMNAYLREVCKKNRERLDTTSKR